MAIYVHKNNQQSGPFEESHILEMLKSGELSSNDLAFRQGEKEWQKLGNLFPAVQNPAPLKTAVEPHQMPLKIAVEPSAPKKSKKGLLLGCAGFFMLMLLVAGILGFLAYRNLFPADSAEDLPNTVKDLKLSDRYPPKGNIWGTETIFVGFYSNETKTKTVLYLMTVYASESAAQQAFREELTKSCKTGETPMYFSFADKNGVEASQGATCAVPLFIQKANKLVTLGGAGASADTFIDFAENLPFNQGTTMKKKTDKY